MSKGLERLLFLRGEIDKPDFHQGFKQNVWRTCSYFWRVDAEIRSVSLNKTTTVSATSMVKKVSITQICLSQLR